MPLIWKVRASGGEEGGREARGKKEERVGRDAHGWGGGGGGTVETGKMPGVCAAAASVREKSAYRLREHGMPRFHLLRQLAEYEKDAGQFATVLVDRYVILHQRGSLSVD